MEHGLTTTEDVTLDSLVAEVAERREEFDRLCHVPRDMIEKMIAIYSDNRLQWIMRDAAVVTQHHFVSKATYDSAGALFAGIPPGTPYP